MTKCRYEHDGVETCNIDTQLFKDSSQEDLFPDFCYFHQIGEIVGKVYIRLDKFYELLGNANLAEGTNNITITGAFAYLHVNKFEELLKLLPSIDAFYSIFDKLMSENRNDSINTNGFYFPVKTWLREINFNPADISKICNNKLVLTGYKLYDVELVRKYLDNYVENRPHFLKDGLGKLKNGNEEILKYGFVDHHTNGMQDIKFNISNITFNNDIDMRGWENVYSSWEYLFTKCTFNSPKISIQSARSIEMKETTISSNNALLDISTSSLNITNSSISSQDVVLSVSYNSLYLDNTLNKEKLFKKASNIKIYDAGSMVKQEKTSFLKYVDLQKVIFYPCNREGTFANNQNLSALEFVNCAFLPGHRLREDYSIPKYEDYYEYSYRSLRKHFDDHIEGNDFHYNYMYWKSKALPNNWDRGADKILIALYTMANGSNTKPSHAIASITVIFVITAIINALFGAFVIKDIYIKEHIFLATNINIVDWEYSLLYSFKNLIPLIQADMFIAKNWVAVLTSITENVLGPLLTTLFVLAFRNRYRRSSATKESE